MIGYPLYPPTISLKERGILLPFLKTLLLGPLNINCRKNAKQKCCSLKQIFLIKKCKIGFTKVNKPLLKDQNSFLYLHLINLIFHNHITNM